MDLFAFAAAAVVLIGMPGPNNVYIATRSASQGRRAGLVSALGVETGTLVHVTLAAFGLAALVTASPVVFRAITWVGAGYLVLLGIRTLRAAGHTGSAGTPRTASLWRVYREGVLVHLFNPKAALFFLAFLPQFTGPGPDIRMQLLGLGAAAFVIGLTLDFGYAIAADAAARGFRTTRSRSRRGTDRSRRGTGRAGRYSAATVYFGLAALAITGTAA